MGPRSGGLATLPAGAAAASVATGQRGLRCLVFGDRVVHVEYFTQYILPSDGPIYTMLLVPSQILGLGNGFQTALLTWVPSDAFIIWPSNLSPSQR